MHDDYKKPDENLYLNSFKGLVKMSFYYDIKIDVSVLTDLRELRIPTCNHITNFHELSKSTSIQLIEITKYRVKIKSIASWLQHLLCAYQFETIMHIFSVFQINAENGNIPLSFQFSSKIWAKWYLDERKSYLF